MEYKLYVGNLPYTTTEDDLQAMFSEAGTVKSTAVIRERDSGRSKGFGFVEMEDQQGMEKAIATLNGKDLQGRALSVSAARPKEERSGGGGFGGGGNRRGGGGGKFSNDRKKPRDNERRNW